MFSPYDACHMSNLRIAYITLSILGVEGYRTGYENMELKSFFFSSDIDECLKSPCGHQGVCDNVPGSYKCSCPNGFEPDENGECVDADECTDDLRCQYGCQNAPGGFRCECPIGYLPHHYWSQCIGGSQYDLGGFRHADF